jgi:superfamily II DNA or RNA helicase
MTPTLRDYQHHGVEEIRGEYAKGCRSVVYVLPTGGGKTTVFSHVAERSAARGNRVLTLVHRSELLRQASGRLAQMGVAHGLIAAGRGMDLSQMVQVASVQTLARRLDKFPPDYFGLIIVDECHHTNAGTWVQVLRYFRARVLGVTATPVRGDGRGLGEWYGSMVLGPSPQELTDRGFLAPARVMAPPGFDATGLKKKMGDYDMRQAGEVLQAGQAMGDALSHYERIMPGRTAIAFCCSVAHAESVAELFRRHGVAAASIDGKTDASRREQLLRDLGDGTLKVLTSCELIGEGVDVPSVGGCILLRPTSSVGLHLQMIGRCLRPQPGKVAVVLDHVGNTLRLGHHLDDREWTLDGAKKRDRETALSVKACPHCFAVMNSQKSVCPDCGHVFVVQQPRELEHVDGELVEVMMQRRERKREQGSAQTVEELAEVGRRRGMKNPRGWARHVLAARMTRVGG